VYHLSRVEQKTVTATFLFHVHVVTTVSLYDIYKAHQKSKLYTVKQEAYLLRLKWVLTIIKGGKLKSFTVTELPVLCPFKVSVTYMHCSFILRDFSNTTVIKC